LRRDFTNVSKVSTLFILKYGFYLGGLDPITFKVLFHFKNQEFSQDARDLKHKKD
jgi:hypothetical protein